MRDNSVELRDAHDGTVTCCILITVVTHVLRPGTGHWSGHPCVWSLCNPLLLLMWWDHCRTLSLLRCYSQLVVIIIMLHISFMSCMSNLDVAIPDLWPLKYPGIRGTLSVRNDFYMWNASLYYTLQLADLCGFSTTNFNTSIFFILCVFISYESHKFAKNYRKLCDCVLSILK